MDKKYIKENEIEIKYLRNQLTAEELEEFEVYLMDYPEMVERLELEAALSNSKNIEIRLPLRNSFRGFRFISYPVVMASLFSLFIGFGFGSIYLHSSIQPLGTTDIAYLSSTRSLNGDDVNSAKFILPPKSFNQESNDIIVLVLEIGSTGRHNYRLQLGKLEHVASSSVSENGYRNLGEYQSDVYGAVNISIPTNQLQKGHYLVLVTEIVDGYGILQKKVGKYFGFSIENSQKEASEK